MHSDAEQGQRFAQSDVLHASAGIKAGREQEIYDEVMDVIFKLTR